MKIPNLVMGMALADYALTRTDNSVPLDAKQAELLQLADYILTHPTSRIFYERALLEMGIHPDTVPSELWGDSVPDEAHGAAKLKEAIAVLNAQWSRHKLARLVAVRNLAWQAQLLARRLEKDCNESAEGYVAKNGGSTAGMFRAFVNSATRAELSAPAPSTP